MSDRVRWVTWTEAEQMATQYSNWPPELEDLVVEELRNRGLRFCGKTHQSREKRCVPVVDGIPLMCSMRSWGGLMADALRDRDPMAYIDWAWFPPEVEVLP